MFVIHFLLFLHPLNRLNSKLLQSLEVLDEQDVVAERRGLGIVRSDRGEIGVRRLDQAVTVASCGLLDPGRRVRVCRGAGRARGGRFLLAAARGRRTQERKHQHRPCSGPAHNYSPWISVLLVVRPHANEPAPLLGLPTAALFPASR